jgi:outer membrane usher protein FimD/PapC
MIRVRTAVVGTVRRFAAPNKWHFFFKIWGLALLLLLDRPAFAAPPPGFEALAGPERAMVDLYLADRLLGTAQITSFNGAIAFEKPDAVLALLPRLRDQAKILEMLKDRQFVANSQLVCTPGADRASCEQLHPSDIGVIFDRDRFTLRIYVNPQLLAEESSTSVAFLKDPERSLGLLANTSAYLSGMSGAGQTINLNSRILAGFGAGRLRSEMTLSSRYGWKAQTLAAELDRPGWRYTAGLFASHPGLMIGRRQILGAAITTQIDTRADRDQLIGTPLVVFLEQRSRVDVSRDGRIIATRIFEAGNQVFDTGTFAEGAYELELRITGANGSVKTEQRFFTKVANRRGDSGSSIYALAGVLADDQHGTPFALRKEPFAQAGGAWALSPRTWVDLSLSATNKTSTAEMGIVHYGKFLVARAGGAISSRRDAGAFLQISSYGSSKLNFNFDLRAVKRSSQSPVPPGSRGATTNR